jgi:uncharacterized membrane protein
LENNFASIKRGYAMKNKRQNASFSTRNQGKVNSEKDSRQSFRRRITIQLAAIFLIIVFLAGECATLFPVE